MADAYEKAEDQADAAKAYATYIESFPEGPRIAEAKRRLEAIRNAVNPRSTTTASASSLSTSPMIVPPEANRTVESSANTLTATKTVHILKQSCIFIKGEQS